MVHAILRRWFAIGLIALCPSIAAAYTTPIAHTIATDTSTANTVTTSAINDSGADLDVVAITYYSPAGSGITASDSQGGMSNTWSCLTAHDDGTNANMICYSSVTHVGSGHTFSASGCSGCYPMIAVQAWAGSAATPFDKENGAVCAFGTTTCATGTTGTLSECNELLVTAAGSQTSSTTLVWSVNSGFTITDNRPLQPGATNRGEVFAYLVQSPTTASNPTWDATNAADQQVSIATFKSTSGACGGGGNTAPSGLTTLGVGK